jgi:hypothetical protein
MEGVEKAGIMEMTNRPPELARLMEVLVKHRTQMTSNYSEAKCQVRKSRIHFCKIKSNGAEL